MSERKHLSIHFFCTHNLGKKEREELRSAPDDAENYQHFGSEVLRWGYLGFGESAVSMEAPLSSVLIRMDVRIPDRWTISPAMFWGRELPHFMEHQRIAVNEEMWRFRAARDSSSPWWRS
jgi:hypothetical protein